MIAYNKQTLELTLKEIYKTRCNNLMIFKSVYFQLKSCIKVYNGLTKIFKCYIGARQGCVNSPVFFLYLLMNLSNGILVLL